MLSNYLTIRHPPGTPVAVVYPTITGYADTYRFRWKKVSQKIHLRRFPHRPDRLAA